VSYRLVCWHPLLTAHMSYTYEAFTKLTGLPLHVVSTRETEQIRAAQGWTTDNAALSHEILPASGWRRRIETLMADDDPSLVHMFGSPFAASRQNYALGLAAINRRNFFLMSEPFLDQALSYLGDEATLSDRVKSAARPIAYRIYGHLLRRRTRGVFAISAKAVEQYRAIGFAPTRLFPFGYFVPPQVPLNVLAAGQTALRVVYLGSFIQRKGVSLLLDAFGRREVQETGATLDLYGPGGPGAEVPPRANYRGSLPFNRVQPTLAEYDMIVVPSLSDGWAVVVNEAIQAGLAVIVSDGVGSSPMVSHWGCGDVFRSGDADDLAAKLHTTLSSPTRMLEQRNAARQLAPLLTPERAARYLDACVLAALRSHPAPTGPWYGS
jgi:glycosyltransferase involved in cell wall biosynthesis